MMNKIHIFALLFPLLGNTALAAEPPQNSQDACAQADILVQQINSISTQANTATSNAAPADIAAQLDSLFQRSSTLCPKNAYINAAYADYLLGNKQPQAAIERYQAALKYRNIARVSPEQQALWQIQLLRSNLLVGNRFEATRALQQVRRLKQRGLTLSDATEQQLKQLDNQLSENLERQPLSSDELQQEYAAFSDKATRDFSVEAPKLQYRITFNSNQASPTTDSLKTLMQIAKTFSDVPLDKIVVIGHTDLVGNATYNQKLSEKRAQAVSDVLTAQYPLLKSKIQIVGKGKSEPLYMDTSEESNHLNRRVEFVFIH